MIPSAELRAELQISLITDSPSLGPEDPAFREHSYDLSGAGLKEAGLLFSVFTPFGLLQCRVRIAFGRSVVTSLWL